MEDFTRWAKGFDQVMKSGVDSIWIMLGRNGSTKAEDTVVKIIKGLKWERKKQTWTYNVHGMRGVWWKVERGVSNQSVSEVVFFCWKGEVPKNLPESRVEVDAGTPLYIAAMGKVPVPTDDSLRTATPGDYEKLKGILGDASKKDSDDEREAKDGPAVELDDPGGLKKKYAKRMSGRALTRQPTADQLIPAFPFDSDPKGGIGDCSRKRPRCTLGLLRLAWQRLGGHGILGESLRGLRGHERRVPPVVVAATGAR